MSEKFFNGKVKIPIRFFFYQQWPSRCDWMLDETRMLTILKEARDAREERERLAEERRRCEYFALHNALLGGYPLKIYLELLRLIREQKARVSKVRLVFTCYPLYTPLILILYLCY